MKLKPEEIQVGDVFVVRKDGPPWTVMQSHGNSLSIYNAASGTYLSVSRYEVSVYHFTFSHLYSNVLPYANRS